MPEAGVTIVEIWKEYLNLYISQMTIREGGLWITQVTPEMLHVLGTTQKLLSGIGTGLLVFNHFIHSPKGLV